MRHVFAWFLLACPLLGAQDTALQPATQPMFRSHASDLVVLPVTVTDNKGRLIPDLQREQFTIFDEGRAQTIAAFSTEDIPVTIALVIDDSGSMGQKLSEVIAASLSFARASHPEDELLVIEFNDRVRDALGGRHLAASDLPDLERALRTLRPQGRTALYDAIMDGLSHLDEAAHARRVLVLVSDGADNASTATLDDVLARARRSNVTIYTIGLFDESSTDRNPGVLGKLASETGGERFLPSSPAPLLNACDRIAREIRNSYTLGYEPATADGRFHELRVDVRDPQQRRLKVRTRPGYVAAQSQ